MIRALLLTLLLALPSAAWAQDNSRGLDTVGNSRGIAHDPTGSSISSSCTDVDCSLDDLAGKYDSVAGAEQNVGANVGAGAGVYKGKSGATLQLKSLVAGDGIGISSGADELTISQQVERTISLDLSESSWTSGNCVAFGESTSDSCAAENTEIAFGKALTLQGLDVCHRDATSIGASASCSIQILEKAPATSRTAAGTSVGSAVVYGDDPGDDTGECATVDFTEAVAAGGAIQIQISDNGGDTCGGVRGSLFIRFTQ